jgi:hypothetical protein
MKLFLFVIPDICRSLDVTIVQVMAENGTSLTSMVNARLDDPVGCHVEPTGHILCILYRRQGYTVRQMIYITFLLKQYTIPVALG